MPTIRDVISGMIAYDAGDPKRIQHFLKVHSFARLISEAENMDGAAREIVEIAAAVHDIGIKASEEKYKSSAGNYQELEGPPLAEHLLTGLGYPKPVVERVCWLVGHHHTYGNIRELDHQVLVEADFLVNLFEDALPLQAVRAVEKTIFKTKTGKWLLRTMFLKA